MNLILKLIKGGRESVFLKSGMEKLCLIFSTWKARGFRRMIKGQWKSGVAYGIVAPLSETPKEVNDRVAARVGIELDASLKEEISAFVTDAEHKLQQGVGIEQLQKVVQEGALITGRFYQKGPIEKHFLFTCYPPMEDDLPPPRRRIFLEY